MFNRKMKRFGIIAVLALMIATPMYMLAQSEIITINNIKIFKNKSRAPVSFTHMNHMTLDGVSCTDCHHRFEDGKNVLDPSELSEGDPAVSCSGCHKTKSDMEKAYHRQCIGCHDKAAKQGKVNGPRMCGECHKRIK